MTNKEKLEKFESVDFKTFTDLNVSSACALRVQMAQFVSPLVEFCLRNHVAVNTVMRELLWSFTDLLKHFGNDCFSDSEISTSLKAQLGDEKYKELVLQYARASAVWYRVSFNDKEVFKHDCVSFIGNLLDE